MGSFCIQEVGLFRRAGGFVPVEGTEIVETKADERDSSWIISQSEVVGYQTVPAFSRKGNRVAVVVLIR